MTWPGTKSCSTIISTSSCLHGWVEVLEEVFQTFLVGTKPHPMTSLLVSPWHRRQRTEGTNRGVSTWRYMKSNVVNRGRGRWTLQFVGLNTTLRNGLKSSPPSSEPKTHIRIQKSPWDIRVWNQDNGLLHILFSISRSYVYPGSLRPCLYSLITQRRRRDGG